MTLGKSFDLSEPHFLYLQNCATTIASILPQRKVKITDLYCVYTKNSVGTKEL